MQFALLLGNDRFVRQMKALGLQTAQIEKLCDLLQGARYTIYEQGTDKLQIRSYRIGGAGLPSGGIEFIVTVYSSEEHLYRNLEVLIPLRVTAGAVQSENLLFSNQELLELEACACEATLLCLGQMLQGA